jgi:GntR family transcriptional regulator
MRGALPTHMSSLKSMYARSRVPLYIQEGDALRHRITNGHWLPGQQISTLDVLEAEFEVARVTVRQAVDLLQNEGLLRTEQGRGTFVAEKLPDKRWLRLETSWDALIASIRDNVIRRIQVDDPPRNPELDDGDGVLAPEYVFLRSVQLNDSVPYSVVNVHLERSLHDRDPEAFRTHTALPVLAMLNRVNIARAHQSLVIGSADLTTARLLQVPLGTPTAESRCVVIGRDGVAMYVAEIIYRNDCVKLHIDLLDDSNRPTPVRRKRRSSR